MKSLSTVFVATSFFGTVFLFGIFDSKAGTISVGSSMPASVFFTQSTTSADLRIAFENASSSKKKLNILIVPGHEPAFGGAEYRDIFERDLNADLGLYLAQYLVEDGHYTVVMTRDKGAWNPYLENYFTVSDEEIKTFMQLQKTEMSRLVGEGKITTLSDSLPHNTAPSDVALRLFGINKWANEHNVDIIIHVHFNDSAPRSRNVSGEYNGFTIYTPERQYSNSQASADLAKYIFKRLSKMSPVSNLPGEDRGIVEDQELIAIGSNNTVDAASILVEYGYIYEPQLLVPTVRVMALKEMAFQTYLGLADFFGKTSLIVGPHESTLLPYEGNATVRKTSLANPEVFTFQAGLLSKGFYPPENFTRNDCPVSGLFGSCTRTALSSFQNKFEIKGEDGVIGTKTRAQLRKLFEPNVVGTR